jgi:ATP-dependent Clp protease ATP-binding subunit ClpA
VISLKKSVQQERRLDPAQTGNEADKLRGDLRRMVVGQNEAIEQIVNVYQTFMAGMNSPGRPIGNSPLSGTYGYRQDTAGGSYRAIAGGQ